MRLSLFAAAVDAPGRTALVVAGQEHTYAELAARVRRILPAVRKRTADTPRAALVGESDLATLEVLYALIELGKPVVLLHPRWTQREREGLLEACAPAALIEPGDLSPTPEDGAETAEWSDGERCLAVVPTSGSGGRPKGVVLSHRAFLASAEASAANLGWQDGDRWLLSLPIAHIGGLSILTRCLHARRTVVVHRGERFDAAEVAEVVERHRVTLISLVPTTLQRLLALDPTWLPPLRMRAFLVGGAAAAPVLLARAAHRGWPVRMTYGLTEACSQIACQSRGSRAHESIGCGRPLSGTEVRIRDGMIEVRGPQLMTGYLPSTEDEPWTADGWLHTGDLGHLDEEGRLHVLGRRDDVIVSGGENVRLSEVEQALEGHPAIAAACAFGVDDDEWGQSVAAALVAVRDAPTEGELQIYLRKGLARFKVPRRIAYLPELARLPSGKVDRRKTAELARARLSVL